MGVPKFYRWISERYPRINQMVSDSALLPEFDNFYLDMNGILHGCTHPNDDGVSKALSERDVMLGIVHYIDRMVTQIVRPQKVLYMAIDGVAPRAKMNQQRSRRFASARDAAMAKEALKASGEEVDEKDLFDSNCITPGTAFMAKVSEHLKYFIAKKIKEDALWQKLTIIFSGHEVPGEGEHKIMQYIRDQQHAGAFSANTRHCMYGQDADLIILGLQSHEPHFTLLREVIDFGQNSRRNKNAVKVVVKNTREAQFQLLHICVLREYLWLEFTRDMSTKLVATACLERFIDDFILLTMLLGNDFLPHMPSLDIGEEAPGLLFDLYRELFPTWGGEYLTCDGQVDDPGRFESLLVAIGRLEDSIFANREQDEAAFATRQAKNAARRGHKASGPSVEEMEAAESNKQRSYEDAMLSRLGSWRAPTHTYTCAPAHQVGGKKDFKGRYYWEKFGITPEDRDTHARLVKHYMEGLSWCLAYYYSGCISWGWFYPFHYVPMISDLVGLQEVFAEIKFELGAPFKPFMQLLGCLPVASSWALPPCYAALMRSPSSPIIDFYPEDFEIDMNGKRNPWEAVNLLPFIDASRLFDAVREKCSDEQLTPAERLRNSEGTVYEYTYDPNKHDTVISCNYAIGWADIVNCPTAVRSLGMTIESKTKFSSQLPPSTRMPYPGFPSMNVLQIKGVQLRELKLNIFGSESRYKTLAVQIGWHSYKMTDEKLDGFAKLMLGRSVFVNWPMMHEARVIGISSETQEVTLKPEGKQHKYTRPKEEQLRWKVQALAETSAYLKGRAIPGSGGMVIGEVELILKLQVLQGMKRCLATGALTKVFGTECVEVPLQMCLLECPAPDLRFEEKGSTEVWDLYPEGCKVVCLSQGEERGCLGTVTSHQGGKVSICLEQRPREPPFGLAAAAGIKDVYYPAHTVYQRLKLRPDVFGKITGSLLVDPGKFDLGLSLKANGRFQLLGYSRCILKEQSAWSTADTVRIVSAPACDESAAEVGRWEFTEAAAKLVFAYQKRFPKLFHALLRLPSDRFYSAEAMFGPRGTEVVQEIYEWLQAIPTAGLPRIPLTTKAMSVEAVKSVERSADVRRAVILSRQDITEREVKGLLPQELLRYDSVDPTHAPMDTEGHPELGDRVVNLCARGVPFALWGTVIACHYHSACVEVVFDEEFMAGGTLQGMCSNYRGLLVPWTTVAKIHTRAQLSKLQSQQQQLQGKQKATVAALAAKGMAQAQAQALEKKQGAAMVPASVQVKPAEGKAKKTRVTASHSESKVTGSALPAEGSAEVKGKEGGKKSAGKQLALEKEATTAAAGVEGQGAKAKQMGAVSAAGVKVMTWDQKATSDGGRGGQEGKGVDKEKGRKEGSRGKKKAASPAAPPRLGFGMGEATLAPPQHDEVADQAVNLMELLQIGGSGPTAEVKASVSCTNGAEEEQSPVKGDPAVMDVHHQTAAAPTNGTQQSSAAAASGNGDSAAATKSMGALLEQAHAHALARRQSLQAAADEVQHVEKEMAGEEVAVVKGGDVECGVKGDDQVQQKLKLAQIGGEASQGASGVAPIMVEAVEEAKEVKEAKASAVAGVARRPAPARYTSPPRRASAAAGGASRASQHTAKFRQSKGPDGTRGFSGGRGGGIVITDSQGQGPWGLQLEGSTGAGDMNRSEQLAAEEPTPIHAPSDQEKNRSEARESLSSLLGVGKSAGSSGEGTAQVASLEPGASQAQAIAQPTAQVGGGVGNGGARVVTPLPQRLTPPLPMHEQLAGQAAVATAAPMQEQLKEAPQQLAYTSPPGMQPMQPLQQLPHEPHPPGGHHGGVPMPMPMHGMQYMALPPPGIHPLPPPLMGGHPVGRDYGFVPEIVYHAKQTSNRDGAKKPQRRKGNTKSTQSKAGSAAGKPKVKVMVPSKALFKVGDNVTPKRHALFFSPTRPTLTHYFMFSVD
ncbi:unnamed protein product [Chrysoparadoxa australica]